MTIRGVEGTAYVVEERGRDRRAVHVFSDLELDALGEVGVRVCRAVDAANQGWVDPVAFPAREWDRDLVREKRVAPRGSAQLGLEKI